PAFREMEVGGEERARVRQSDRADEDSRRRNVVGKPVAGGSLETELDEEPPLLTREPAPLGHRRLDSPPAPAAHATGYSAVRPKPPPRTRPAPSVNPEGFPPDPFRKTRLMPSSVKASRTVGVIGAAEIPRWRTSSFPFSPTSRQVVSSSRL